MANCKICIKSHKCDICKTPKNHNSTNYSKDKKYDVFAYWELICKCVIKKYYTTCSIKKGKYFDCEDLPSKCISNSKFILFY